MIEEIILASLTLPIVAALVSVFTREYTSMIVSTVSYIPLTASSLYSALVGLTYKEPLLDLGPPVGSFYILNDPLSSLLAFSIGLVSLAVAPYSLPYMRHRFSEVGLGVSSFRVFYPLYNLYAVSMAWLVYSGNLIMIYIFLEVALITSFLLIYYYGYGNRQFVGILYFVWTHIASVLALLGFIIVSLENGTAGLGPLRYSPLASLLILLGMLIKLPAAGPHIWLPYAHAEAPTPVSALLSPLTVGLAGYILARIYVSSPSFAEFITQYRDPLLAYGIITGIYGALSVIMQRDYKRLLAYSTVSQMGYMLIGLSLGPYGIVGLALQYVAHALGKAILFMTAGAIIAQYGIRDIGRMGGLHAQLPTVSGAAVIGFMTITGIVTVGLLAEFYILLGLSSTLGLSWYSMLYLLGVIAVFILSVVYGFYTMRVVFYGRPRANLEVAHVDRLLDVPMYLLAAFSVLLLLPPLATGIIHSLIGVVSHA